MQAREAYDDGPSGSQRDPFSWSLRETDALTDQDELSSQSVAATAADAIRAPEADFRAWHWLDLGSARNRATSLTQVFMREDSEVRCMVCPAESRISLAPSEFPPSGAWPRNEVGLPSTIASSSRDWSRWAACSWARPRPLRSRTTTPAPRATQATSAELVAGLRAARRRPWPPAWCRSHWGHRRSARCCVRHRTAVLLGSDLPSDCWRREGAGVRAGLGSCGHILRDLS